jgi:hypothetical protein
MANLTKLEQWHEIQRQGMGEYVKANPDMQEFLKMCNEEFSVGEWVKFYKEDKK